MMLTRLGDPFRELHRFQDRMNRLFNEAFAPASQPNTGEENVSIVWAPPVDIAQTTDKLVFQVEVPGFKRDELHLSVENGSLTLEGERKFEKETKEKSYHRVERSYGRFYRSFALPADVDASNVSANLSDGVLTVELPKREESRPKEIPISSGGPKQLAAEKKVA